MTDETRRRQPPGNQRGQPPADQTGFRQNGPVRASCSSAATPDCPRETGPTFDSQVPRALRRLPRTKQGRTRRGRGRGLGSAIPSSPSNWFEEHGEERNLRGGWDAGWLSATRDGADGVSGEVIFPRATRRGRVHHRRARSASVHLTPAAGPRSLAFGRASGRTTAGWPSFSHSPGAAGGRRPGAGHRRQWTRR